MPFDFDSHLDRRATDSHKWNCYDPHILPMWVADMDFLSPPAIQRALHARIAQGHFGYAETPKSLTQAIIDRLYRQYQWQLESEDIVYLPGLVCGLNIAARAVGQPGDGVLINTPVYGPFSTAPTNQDRTVQFAPQVAAMDGCTLHYEVDFDALEAAVLPSTGLLFLCNPHNPTGRAFTRSELQAYAALAERHDLVICSDEIHCDLVLGGSRHIPTGSLSPEIGRRTITLMAPSKTFNIPGLGSSYAIIQDAPLRARFIRAMAGIVPHMNLLGATAMEAAYTECEDWLVELLEYLTANRDFLVNYVRDCLPGVRTTVPQATYLAWLDLREMGIEGRASQFLLDHANLAVNDGHWFGAGGEGFVRLNFGCSRSTLEEGLERLRRAIIR
jgi:cystathionine beta-lyase